MKFFTSKQKTMKHKLLSIIKNDKIIQDEYGREYSFKEFISVLDECPIQFDDSIGKEFS